MTGLNAHVVYLYPRWMLSKGNGAKNCISRQPLALFAPLFFNDLNQFKDFKTPNITQSGALAGKVQYMAAQKVVFTLRPIRYGPPNVHVNTTF